MNKTKAYIPSLVYPPFQRKMEQLQAACLARGVDYWLTSGLRSWEEQNQLYALGRTKKNVDATPEKPMGGIVTNARAGQSYHNFGIAADFALDKDLTRAGLQPDWNLEAYEVLAEESLKIRMLEAGLYWKTFKDGPHIQLNIGKAGLTLALLTQLYNKGGMPLVWATLDKYNW